MRKVRVEASTPEGRFTTDAETVELEAIRQPIIPHAHPDWLQIPSGVLCVVDAVCGEVWTRDKGRQWLAEADLDALVASEV